MKETAPLKSKGAAPEKAKADPSSLAPRDDTKHTEKSPRARDGKARRGALGYKGCSSKVRWAAIGVHAPKACTNPPFANGAKDGAPAGQPKADPSPAPQRALNRAHRGPRLATLLVMTPKNTAKGPRDCGGQARHGALGTRAFGTCAGKKKAARYDVAADRRARAKGVHGPTLRYEGWGTQRGNAPDRKWEPNPTISRFRPGRPGGMLDGYSA
jgi:hypothetical protein